ncbi:hypothetical protein [Antarctobacter sp.]|uniref:hypothetical protein n=1 Tax=Antarctobacter sp. TaxID=1872577 RepID=UPI002B277F07|nr:hypothetical protein [Antarctobacter sp.]
MSFAKTIGVFALAGLAGLGIFSIDYATQWSRSDADFGGPQYVQTLMTRFGAQGGIVGLVLRKSSVVAAALPPAPAGWNAESWSADHEGFLYSREQSLAYDREILRATRHLPRPVGLTQTDEALWEAFLADTSMVYINDQGVIGLDVDDPARRIVHPYWTPFIKAMERHFNLVDQRSEHATYQGVRWVEVRGPIEMADNGLRPHRLRVFKARLGEIDVMVTARAPVHHIERFFQTVDLSGIRSLAEAPEGEMPRSLPAKMALAPTETVPVTPTQIRVNRGLD